MDYIIDDFLLRFKLKPLQMHHLNWRARRVHYSLFREGWWTGKRIPRDTLRNPTFFTWFYEPYMGRTIRQSHFWVYTNMHNRYCRGPKKAAFYVGTFQLYYL